MASKSAAVKTSEINKPTDTISSGVDTKVERKAPVSQRDVPSMSLEEALRVARAIGDNYAYKNSRPLDVAAALNMSPTSSSFKMLCGASIAYGLTEGGYNATEIKVMPLARKILEPTEEGQDLLARREAVLTPRVIATFLKKYDGHKLPREDIAKNVLISLEVPRDATERTMKVPAARPQGIQGGPIGRTAATGQALSDCPARPRRR